MSRYDAFALEYAAHCATSPYNTQYERPAMLAQLPDINGKHVLDAACASGEYIPFLLERGARVTAVDNCAPLLQLVSERFDERVVTLEADLDAGLPALDDSVVDVVLSSLTVHYIADWHKLFAEFRRVLVPGGMLLFSTHHPAQTAELAGDYFQTKLVNDRWSINGRQVDVQFYHRPLEAILAPLLLAGFAVTAVLEPQSSLQAGKPWFLIVKATAA